MAATINNACAAGRVAALCLCLAMTAACADEPADEPRRDSDILSFGISMSDDWHTPTTRTLPAVTGQCETADFDGSELMLTASCGSMAGSAPAVPTLSRAAEISTGSFYDNFGVYGYVYQGNSWRFRENVKPYITAEKAYSKGSGIWGTDATYFWPDESYRAHFIAYAPFDMADLTVNGLTPQLDYEVPDAAPAQRDLLYAVADVEGNYGKTLNLQFGHMLSAVKVHVAQTVEATIKNVTLKNVKYKGTYDFDKCRWTVADDRKDFSFDCDITTDIDKPTSEPIADGEYTFMMLPQNFSDEPLLLELTLVESTGEQKTHTSYLYPSWEEGNINDYLIWRTFRGTIYYKVNNTLLKQLSVMNVTPGKERILRTQMPDTRAYVEEWSLSPDLDEYITSLIWNINRKEFTVYTRGAILIFYPNNPSDAAVTNLPQNAIKTGREYEYTFESPRIPVCSGYTFKGWAIRSNQTEPTYPAGTDITITLPSPDADPYISLYAVWEKE